MDTEARVFRDVSASMWRSEGTDMRPVNLDRLLKENAATAKQKSLYRNDREKLEAASIIRSVNNTKSYAAFGLLLGSLPPAAIFLRVFSDVDEFKFEHLWIVALLLLVNSGAAITGFLTGKVVGRSMSYVYGLSLSKQIPFLVLIGLTWGIVAGGAGGVFFFVIGALVGAVFGGIVGAAALPVFALLHNFLRRGDVIDRRHFLPLAFGVTLTICAYILGLY